MEKMYRSPLLNADGRQGGRERGSVCVSARWKRFRVPTELMSLGPRSEQPRAVDAILAFFV